MLGQSEILDGQESEAGDLRKPLIFGIRGDDVALAVEVVGCGGRTLAQSDVIGSSVALGSVEFAFE